MSGRGGILHAGRVPLSPDLAELARSPFVLLTTYRRTGVGVPTPVWIASDGDRLLVTTGAASGKVKRLAHDPRVTLTPCDARGRVKEGAPSVAAVAVVDGSAETRAALDAALLAKYGLQYRMLRARTKRRPEESVPLVITAA